MNCRRPVKARDLSAEVLRDVRRIDTMWADCRSRFGQGGPFLFGRFTAVDAMYAPIVLRFETYAIEIGRALLHGFANTVAFSIARTNRSLIVIPLKRISRKVFHSRHHRQPVEKSSLNLPLATVGGKVGASRHPAVTNTAP